MKAKKPRYAVQPAIGRAGAIKPGIWNVIDTRNKEVMRGLYYTEALAQLIADAMNLAATQK